MARFFVTPSGSVILIPSSTISTNVVTTPTGVSTSGVIAIVGEADGGPHWTEEAKLSTNLFAATDIAKVKAKYGSGRLVDAFAVATSPSASAAITGTFNRILLVKTNKSTKASKNTLDGHGKIEAKVASADGNNIFEKISVAQSEVAPTTGQFSYVPSASASILKFASNGGAEQSISISANETPAALASAIDATGDLLCQGGNNLDITNSLTIANTVEVDIISGQNIEIILGAGETFTNSCSVGDVIRIPSGSVIEGSGFANIGWYLVTGFVNTALEAKISAKKITSGAPVAVISTNFSATPANDLVAYGSMSVKNMSGTDRDVLNSLTGINAACSASQSYLTFTVSGALFVNQAKVGDIAYIAASTTFSGAGSANVGWYQVVESQNVLGSVYIKMQKLSNGNPVAVLSAAIAPGDLIVFNPQIRGYSKSMELYDGSGVANISTIFKQLGVDSPASFVGSFITSSAELKTKFNFGKSSGSIQESFTFGGNVIFKIGYNGSSATMSIVRSGNQVLLQTSVSGGAGTNVSIDLAKVPTISDLVTTINALPGYTAELLNNTEAVKSPLVLDEVSAVGICSKNGNKPGRIKRDTDDIVAGKGNINSTSQLVNYNLNIYAGLPDAEGTYFLANGAKGSTSAQNVSDAISALAATRVNFVVPMFSRDASDDIADGLTESSSTYMIDDINAAVKNHCILMSTEKTKRHRICGLSKKDTFTNQKSASQNLNHYRVNFFFQDVIDLDANGSLQQFQPCYNALKGIAMQAAGNYKAIYNKPVNLSGVVNPTGFDDQIESDCEDAISAGMIPMQIAADGSFLYLADQTTYGFDNNFVYNSMQAVYVADLMAVTLADAVQRTFIGSSTADVTPSTITTFIRAKIREFKNNKWAAATDQYPEGWKSINVQIQEDVLYINCEVIEGTSIRFAPISLAISGVQASATA